MYDLRQIECFVAVADELHFRRAALRLNMTQPPLSRQIRLLEHELQFQLFDRTSRTVALTHAGTVFLQDARRVLALAGNAAESARRVAKGESGRLNLGFTAGSSYRLLPKLVAHTKAKLKNIDIVLHEMLSRDQVEALHEYRLDIAVFRRQSDDESIEISCIAREAMMLVLPAHHPLAKGRRPSISDLDGEHLIGFSPMDGPYFNALIERVLEEAGISVRYEQRVGQIHSILALVGAGQGVALVPESACAMNFQNTVTRKIKMQPIEAELYLGWKRDNLNPALRVFLETVMKEFAIT